MCSDKPRISANSCEVKDNVIVHISQQKSPESIISSFKSCAKISLETKQIFSKGESKSIVGNLFI